MRSFLLDYGESECKHFTENLYCLSQERFANPSLLKVYLLNFMHLYMIQLRLRTAEQASVRNPTLDSIRIHYISTRLKNRLLQDILMTLGVFHLFFFNVFFSKIS